MSRQSIYFVLAGCLLILPLYLLLAVSEMTGANWIVEWIGRGGGVSWQILSFLHIPSNCALRLCYSLYFKQSSLSENRSSRLS